MIYTSSLKVSSSNKHNPFHSININNPLKKLYNTIKKTKIYLPDILAADWRNINTQDK